MRLALRDELLDAQLLRTAGAAVYGGADLGECLAAASRVRGTDLGSWHDAWWSLANSVEERGAASEREGALVTAREAYFRASAYYRTAAVMSLSRDRIAELRRCIGQQRDVFRRAAALLPQPPELVTIPFGSAELPGYFFPAPDGDDRATTRRPTLILIGGYDGTAEELYFANAAAALARGYHVLAFDGPGQGSALLAGLTMTPDWDSVLTCVVDFLLARDDVDAARIALMGWSLGGFLAARAAAREHRIAAVLADCGSVDLQSSFLARLPQKLADSYRANSPLGRRVLAALLGRVSARPTAGWALRRGMLVHGVDTPLAYLDELSKYNLDGHAQLIRCPVWIAYAETDDISATAPQLAEALTVPHELVLFTAADGADNHCEAGARLRFHARAFGWLDAQLHP